MNSDDLSLFAQIVKAGSISRAAMQLGVDQSTVSRRIGLLEAELGVRLLHRSGRGVAPTGRGKQLQDYAVSMAQMLAEAQKAMHDSAQQGPAQLCIAAQPTIASLLFGPLRGALKERYPLTKVHFVEALASQALEKLANGDLDLAVLYIPEHAGALEFDVLLSEGVGLITPPDCPRKGGEIAVKHLGDFALILPSTRHGLRVLVESLAARHAFSTDISLEFDGSIALTKRLVMQNCGCTVLPLAAVIDEVNAGRLKSYRLVDPEIRRSVGLVLGKTRVSPARLWETAGLVKAQVARLVQSGAWPDAVLDAALLGARQAATP